MAAAVSTLFSDVVLEAGLWDDHRPDHGLLLTTVGAGAATAGPATSRALLNIAARSPTVLAFVLAGDVKHVYVGYAPSLFPGDLAVPTPFDDKVVVLVGDDIPTSVTITLPDTAFQRTAAIRCLDVAGIIGPQGHGAVPPEYLRGPHIAGTPDTTEIRARRAFLMPAVAAGLCLTTQPAG